MTYAIQLGREPLLSVLELESALSRAGISSEVQTIGSEVALFNSDENPEKVFHSLGGSVKLGKLINRFGADEFLEDPLRILASDLFVRVAIGEEKSVSFAISAFGATPKGFRSRVKRIALEWKKHLKEQYAHVRYVESKDRITSSVTVSRNKLLRGCDLWVVFVDAEVLLIKTLAVQDYRAFSDRDFGRPRRNARNGMLPPKLARMMVHLSGADSDAVLHDPFVGSGTILQEAVLLGVSQVIGTDINEKNISDTKANLEWLAERTEKTWKAQLDTGDIHDLDPKKFSHVTHVVSEIDLGDPLLSEAGERQAKEHAREAKKLFQGVLDYVNALPQCTVVVLAIPFWKHQKKSPTRVPFELPIGFDRVINVDQASAFPHEVSERGGLDYSRPDQFVGREIFVLMKK